MMACDGSFREASQDDSSSSSSCKERVKWLLHPEEAVKSFTVTSGNIKPKLVVNIMAHSQLNC